jgi:hypothetical protein
MLPYPNQDNIYDFKMVLYFPSLKETKVGLHELRYLRFGSNLRNRGVKYHKNTWTP